ncbi:MAG: hypothetical protein HYV26_22355 [Candidatus Hydrogenedentes bacterium]|nr:hypothetical protein [Candidatus Hydrogenedentota bacterium]
MTLLPLILALLSADAFDRLEFPLPSAEARFFTAKVEPAGPAELFVLDGLRLTVFQDSRPDSSYEVNLRPGTTAVDIADLNGDGRSEIVSVAGDALVRYGLPTPSSPDGTDLFSLHTQFANAATQPFLHVLVVPRVDVPALALPTDTALELRSAAGDLLDNFPLAATAVKQPRYGEPFSSRASNPPQIGPPGSLEMRVNSVVANAPELPGELQPLEAEGVARRMGTPRQMVEAAAMPPEAWPWFPLREEALLQERALYAAADAAFSDLLVRIRAPQATGDAGAQEFRAGPARRYPGMLVTRQLRQPDFNGDSYADLLLWSPAEASITVNALTRAAVSGAWPLLLRVHLYVPEKERFDPRAASTLSLQAPLSWYLEMPSEAPLKHLVFADFNGDTRTDFGCSRTAEEYAVWLYGEQGFDDTPTAKFRFDAPLREVLFTEDLAGKGRTCIALLGDARVYVLAPNASMPSYSPPIKPEQLGMKQ